jgi:hypothetical protein
VANNVASQVPVHANLVLASNTFTNLRSPGLFITRANDTVVVSNQFTNTNLSRLPFLYLNLGTANLGGSIVIDHAHSIFLSNNTMQAATTGPISIDSKSSYGIKRRPWAVTTPPRMWFSTSHRLNTVKNRENRIFENGLCFGDLRSLRTTPN